jgi:two-component system, OmpR family, sensor kinase
VADARGSRLNSLRARLLLAIGLIVVLSVGLTLAVGAVLTRREVERATLRDLSHQADLLAGRERAALLPFSPRDIEAMEPFLDRQGEKAVAVAVSRPSPYLPSEAREELRAGRGAEGSVRVGGTSYYFAARGPVRGEAFVLLRPKSLSASNSRPYLQGLLLAGLLGIALAALASFLIARAIARPVRRVAEATRSLAAARSPEPLPAEGANELISLADSFNDMATRLERARTAEHSFLLSVSHELKTPLTAIRGYAEGLQDGAVPVAEAAETIAVEAGRLERLVHDLLDLARMRRSEFSVHREPIELDVAAREAVRRYEAQASSFGVKLEAVASKPAPALGDADRLLQVVSNLVENALRCTPPGGRVRVVAEPSLIAVEDTGPGLQPDELPRAFERFYLHGRYASERQVGTGLGLAIVKGLVEGMGGHVEVDSELGRGTRFTVRLPAPPASERAEAAAEQVLVSR